jgi:hypothetical protein
VPRRKADQTNTPPDATPTAPDAPLDPRLRRYLPRPLTPAHEAALDAALDADGPPALTPEYVAWLAAVEPRTPALEAQLAAARAHIAHEPPPTPRRHTRRRPPVQPA